MAHTIDGANVPARTLDFGVLAGFDFGVFLIFWPRENLAEGMRADDELDTHGVEDAKGSIENFETGLSL